LNLHLDGTNTIQAPRDRVYALLTSPEFLSRSLPDAEEVRVTGPQSLEARLKVRVAVVSSTLKMMLNIAKTDPPTKATLTAEGEGSGSHLKIASVFTLSGESSTSMGWAADAEITGVMAGLGSTLLKGFATKKVAEIFEGITKAVEAEAK